MNRIMNILWRGSLVFLIYLTLPANTVSANNSTTNLTDADVITHIVDRGQTLSWIAKYYGVSEAKIKSENGIEDVYCGQELKIKVSSKQNGSVSTQYAATTSNSIADRVSKSKKKSKAKKIRVYDANEEDALASEASKYFKEKKWGKATKIYSKLIKKYPRSLHYFNRGVCHYNNDKYRQASNDFTKCLSMPDATENVKKRAPGLLADSKKRHAAWQEQQNQLWGAVIGTVVDVGLNTWATVEQSKAAQKQVSSSPGSSSYSSGSSGSYSSSSDNSYSSSSATSTSSSKKRCVPCRGTGACHPCGGSGIYRNYGQELTCSTCKGEGKCRTCGGTGVEI